MLTPSSLKALLSKAKKPVPQPEPTFQQTPQPSQTFPQHISDKDVTENMNIFNSILSNLPFILQGIVTVEQNFASQPGATKKQLLLSSIDAAAKVGEQVPVPIVSGVSALIDSLVSILNSSGAFNHKAAPVTAQ